jgi:hypothetical protein
MESTPNTVITEEPGLILLPLAVTVVVPGPTPVTSIEAVVAPDGIVTVAGTVAAAGLLDTTLTEMPPDGAGADSVTVRFPDVPPTIVTLGGLNDTEAVTKRSPVAPIKFGADAEIVVAPKPIPVIVGCAAGSVAPPGKATDTIETAAFEESPNARVTIRPAGGAGVDKLMPNVEDCPSEIGVEGGMMICPGWAVEIVTVTGGLDTNASLTISWITYDPATSGMNVGLTLAGADSEAVLPVGLELNVHANLSGSPSASEDPAALRVTTDPSATVCAGPGFATGVEFVVVIATVDGALSLKPFFTINWTT